MYNIFIIIYEINRLRHKKIAPPHTFLGGGGALRWTSWAYPHILWYMLQDDMNQTDPLFSFLPIFQLRLELFVTLSYLTLSLSLSFLILLMVVITYGHESICIKCCI